MLTRGQRLCRIVPGSSAKGGRDKDIRHKSSPVHPPKCLLSSDTLHALNARTTNEVTGAHRGVVWPNGLLTRFTQTDNMQASLLLGKATSFLAVVCFKNFILLKPKNHPFFGPTKILTK